jgi:16S rRNA (guanine527-N7)-methyltransferase
MDESLDLLCRGLDYLGIPPDSLTIDRYEKFIAELIHWCRRYRLVSKPERLTIVRDHLLDSLSVVASIRRESIPVIVDLGAGAGFPGLCVKIALPQIPLTLIDSREHRVQFLKAACGKLNLVECHIIGVQLQRKITRETAGLAENFSIVLARGFASLKQTVSLGLPLLQPGGCFILHRGSDAVGEIEESKTYLDRESVTLETVIPDPLAEFHAAAGGEFQADRPAKFVVILRKKNSRGR